MKATLVKPGPLGTLGLVALLCGAWVGLARAEEAKAPEPLETELIRARNMIMNASSRLRNDVLGMSQDEDESTTLVRRCCNNNVEKIDQASRESARILNEFDRCYERAGNTDMVLRARVTQADLGDFARLLPSFADANTKHEAEAALTGLSRAYNRVREDAVGLAACDDVALREPDPATQQDSKKKKTKSKKDAADQQSREN